LNATELRAAIVETFREIDSERNALEPLALFCEHSLAQDTRTTESLLRARGDLTKMKRGSAYRTPLV
jgi:hypothetical protein